MSRRPLDKAVAAAQARRARAAAQLAAEDAALASLLEAQRALIDAVVAEHRTSGLRNQHAHVLIDTMIAETSVRGARLETKHPAALKIRKVDKSIARFADKNGLKDTTVRSWYATGVAAREIPRKYADLLAKPPYSIPLSAWRNGISE